MQLTDKSWMLTKKKIGRCGLMRKDGEEGYAVLGGPYAGKYETLEVFENKANDVVEFVEEAVKEDKEDIIIEGYPVKHDEVFDVLTEEYPSYTKREGSSDRYAVGFWCINFNGKWHGHYCPRVKTLTENENIGPLKTKLEMDHILRIENNK